jgi:hypothetical protein
MPLGLFPQSPTEIGLRHGVRLSIGLDVKNHQLIHRLARSWFEKGSSVAYTVYKV